MAEESTFASESATPVEKSELQQIQERLASYKATLDPRALSVIQTLAQSQLANGLLKLEELDAMVLLRDEVNRANIDYQTMLKRSQTRAQELLAEQEANKAVETENLIAEQKNVTAKERVRRKEAEAKYETANQLIFSKDEEIARLTKELEQMKSGVTKKPSKAFEQARALNPLPPADPMESWQVHQPEEFDLDHAPTRQEVQDEMVEQGRIEEAEEQLELDLGIKGEVANELPKPDWNIDSISDQMAKAIDDIEKELEIEESITDDDYETPVVQEEEVQTEYGAFSKPVISNSQLPESDTIADQLSGKKEIKSYDTVEELQAAVDEKNKLREEAQEEEYEEITIPTPDELNKMTKSNIFGEAKKLNFNSVVMTMTKSEMIEEFQRATEEFIASLQETGELVSSEGFNFAEAEINDEGKSDEDNGDRQDGGYF